MTNSHLESVKSRLLELPANQLRPIIAMAAIHTPGIFYTSGDLDPQNRDQEKITGITPSLLLLAAQASQELDVGTSMEIHLTGLTGSNGVKLGDWSVKITNTDDLGDALAPCPDQALISDLFELKSDEIRTVLSKVSEVTPKTVYLEKGFGDSLRDNDTKNPMLQRIACKLCNWLDGFVKPNQYYNFGFVSCFAGSENHYGWNVVITRHSD